ncbi:DUF4369 domain-containing protein [Arenibacter sp. GZD96]|uniref:DUF4369 domain-containing protein n=1 Tax=Aurantibrevibacter litoralis TaxID=3106030 RepID=UPI002AFF9169|nr:DUF4369 domain-containing protein [Arenibacter sp. GZD-96]MEA1787534.1 DUF4369 domain-containing protein [Arenibacter sp. GZD-96]
MKPNPVKKLFLTAALVCIIAACSKDSANTMTVTGNVKGLKKGTLYLQHLADTTLVTLDSLVLKGDGAFTFKTELDSPEIFYLYLNKKDDNDINDRLIFFGEPGVITINTTWNTFDTQAKISGSETHKKLVEYREVMSKFNVANLENVRAFYDPKINQDPIAMDSVQKINDRNTLRGYLYALNFALNNKDSYIAPYIALYEVPDANLKYLDSIHKSLHPEVSQSKYGKALYQYIESQKSKE